MPVVGLRGAGEDSKFYLHRMNSTFEKGLLYFDTE